MEKRPKVWYDYSKFLLRSIGFSKKGYSKLIKYLHDVPYEWCSDVPFDENRGRDGESQRYYFFKSVGVKGGAFEYPCSVLEMLIAFAKRFGTDWLGYDEEDMGEHYDRVFWLFIHNLGLDNYNDEYFFEDEVDEILYIWMERKYKNDGNGSIFPLNKPVKMYNKLEMYKQIFEYMNQTGIDSTQKLQFLD